MSDVSTKFEKTVPPPSQPNRLLTVISTTLTGLLLYLLPPTIASIILLVWVSARGMTMSQASHWLNTTPAQFFYVLITELLVLGLLALFIKWTYENWRDIGVLRRPKWRHIGYTIIGLAVYFSIYVVVATLLSGVLNFNQKQELGFNNSAAGGELALVFASLVILPPVVEEALFRGYLYTRFRRVLSVRFAALAVSLLFCSAHLQLGSGNPPLWSAALDTFILSMVLVYVREKTGTIWAGVGIHMIKNLIAFSILFIHL